MVVGSPKGLAGVKKKAAELAASRQSFGLRRFTPEFRFDGNKPPTENALNLRVLGDEIIVTTQMHRGVPLPENKYFFGVCRKADPIFADYCYVCDVQAKNFEGDNKQKKRNGLIPTDVAVALAVEMEPVKGSAKSWKPKLVEFEIPQLTEDEKASKAPEESVEYRKLLNKLGAPGSKVMIPNIGMLVGTISGQQALFDIPSRRKSISDRTFEVSRHGAALATKWGWEHEGEDPDYPDPSVLLESFQGKYPFEMPEEWVVRMADEGRYNHFFKLGGNTEGVTEAAAETADDVEPVADSRSELMERLKGAGSGN